MTLGLQCCSALSGSTTLSTERVNSSTLLSLQQDKSHVSQYLGHIAHGMQFVCRMEGLANISWAVPVINALWHIYLSICVFSIIFCLSVLTYLTVLSITKNLGHGPPKILSSCRATRAPGETTRTSILFLAGSMSEVFGNRVFSIFCFMS